MAATALLLAGVAPAAASPSIHRSARSLPGREVHPSPTASRAPRIDSGGYLVRLPRHGSTYLRFRRAARDTTVHVGVEMVGRGGSVGEGFDVAVGTTAGQSDCGSAVDFRPTGGETAPVLYAATSTWAPDPGNRCEAARDLYLTVHAPNDPADAGRPVQLRVYEEPPVDAASLSMLTTPSPATWSALAPGTPHDVAAAHTVDDAPLVRDGTWRLHIRAGQQDFLAVPVDWGDSLRAQLDARLPAGADASDPGLTLQLLGPLLDHVDTGGLGTDSSIGRTASGRHYRTGVMTYPVAYINRDTVDATIDGADLAGVHYVELGYLPTGGPRELSVDLTVQRLAGAHDAPFYSSVAGVQPPVADSRLVDGSLARDVRRDRGSDRATAQQPGTISSHSGFPWLSVVLVVVGLAVLGGLFDGALVLHRRRQHRHHGRHRT